MEKLVAQAIMILADKDVAPQPSVYSDDKITDAIEVMLKSNLKRIAVTDGNRIVGMIKLEDALKKVGLEGEFKSKGRRSIVFQGRKIILDE